MRGKLYLIPTPIGNLNELSKRFFDVVNECDYIACEDTRVTQKLLKLVNISKPCFSCHEHNEVSASKKIIDDLLEGKTIGYMSDAGYPCISDPGSLLVKEALQNDIDIIPLSGPNAFLNALVGSGLDTSHFLFYGFLSSKPSEQIKELSLLKNLTYTLIFYEAPHRINKTLSSLYEVLGNRKITIARELTKLHEEFIRSDLETLIKNQREYIGELVVIVEGNTTEVDVTKDQIIETFKRYINAKFTTKDAILATSIALNVKKNLVYQIVNNIED